MAAVESSAFSGPDVFVRNESEAGGRGQGVRPTSLSDHAPSMSPCAIETRVIARPCTEAGPLPPAPCPALGPSKSHGYGMPNIRRHA